MVAALFAGQIPTAAELNALFTGFAGYGQRTSTSTGSTSTTAVGVMRLDNVVATQGRAILIGYSCHPDSATVSDNVRIELRSSTSGAATTASTIVPNSQTFATVSAGVRHWMTVIIPPADATYSFILTFARNSGASSCTLFCDATRFTEIMALNMGVITDTGVDL